MALCPSGSLKRKLLLANELDNALRLAGSKYKTSQMRMIESQETAYGPWAGANTNLEFVTYPKYSIDGDEVTKKY
ncbi:MAG: hypothetical protein GY777_25615 [Candidatus Brocadiaceae bacterium]|nr:hypothetical protein [Candidatus Brocadiaceae bacterium]